MPSLLAEPRRKKQKMGMDPRNLQWRYSSDNFGARILGKMGWEEGRGIGKHEQGMSENLRVKPNFTSKGIGYDVTSDRTWIAHNDDFARILDGLNKAQKEKSAKNDDDEKKAKVVNAKISSKELKIERIRQRLKRKKYIKNLADCSEYDKAGIFGNIAATTTAENQTASEETKQESADEESEKPSVLQSKVAQQTHTISTVSMSDYFAQKMREKSTKRNPEPVKENTLAVENQEDVNTKQAEQQEAGEERRQRKAARKMEKRK